MYRRKGRRETWRDKDETEEKEEEGMPRERQESFQPHIIFFFISGDGIVLIINSLVQN